MKHPYYSGTANLFEKSTSLAFPAPDALLFRRDPKNYLPDPGLVDAANVALLLGQPLLLTGEPGTGKTDFAYNLAHGLGLAEPLKFETKSTSNARELFYTYDALKRFQDSQSGITSSSALPYISYGPLGTAILLSQEPRTISQVLPPSFKHQGKRRSVVLIDEVDKAPRDFPNDILNELEQMYFRISELGGIHIEADPTLCPAVVITSNSEKDLPDAFLRRCVFYNIPFPDSERLKNIVAIRIGNLAGSKNTFLSAALELFHLLRNPSSNLDKKPATAELLNWIVALRRISSETENEDALMVRKRALNTLSALVKMKDDYDKAIVIVKQWIQTPK